MAFNLKQKEQKQNKIVKGITENHSIHNHICAVGAVSQQKRKQTNKTKAKTKITRILFELFCLVIYRAPSHGGTEINSTKKIVINTETKKEET